MSLDTSISPSPPDPGLTGVAYFSLGFQTGNGRTPPSRGEDHPAAAWLREAGDLGVPVFGVGLLQPGGGEGDLLQHHLRSLPLQPLPLRQEIVLSGRSQCLRAWVARVGQARLFLLDSDEVPSRAIPGPGPGTEGGLEQDLLLGIGGWRLLEALDLHPGVCHFDEGHGAFAVLERARSFMRSQGQPFEVALAVTRAGNVFTTRTRVMGDFDRHGAEWLEERLGVYAREELGLPLDALMALGRANPADGLEPFSMDYLAMRGCGRAEGVSRLPFQAIFPRWPLLDIPLEPLAPWVPAYAQSQYLPASEQVASRIADRGEMGWKICTWRDSLREQWPGLHFGQVVVETEGPDRILQVEVLPGDLEAHAFDVELYGEDSGRSVRGRLERMGPLGGPQGGFAYRGRMPRTLDPKGFTVRAIPAFPGVAVPLEESHITWQR